MKILVIQQKMIGDVLTSSILFEALKTKYPKAELYYLINSHTFPVVENNTFIDKFIFFSPEVENNKCAFFKLIKTVREERFDIVIDVYGKMSSHIITLFSGAKIKCGYYKKHSSFIFTHSIKRRKKPTFQYSLAIENRMLLIEPLGIVNQVYTPKIFIDEKAKNDAQIYLQDSSINTHKPLIMVSILGSDTTKTYPLKYMSKLLDYIVEVTPQVQLLFNYIPSQISDAELIYNNCQPLTQQHIHFNVFGKSLKEFLAITSFCNAVIGNEGGAINMAKASSIKTFAIFSPYLNVQNWFGKNESELHENVHLLEFIEPYDMTLAKKNPELYYLKFKPEFIIPKLKKFLQQVNDDL